jgi:hypothetical protein
MKDNKLTSITEYSDCLETLDVSDSEKWILHRLRKDFGKKKLQLGDFAPCVNGAPMDEPENLCYHSVKNQAEWKEYQQAQSRVLFEGFEMTVNVHGEWYVEGYGFCIYSDSNITIEDIVKLKPTLTEIALKQIR